MQRPGPLVLVLVIAALTVATPVPSGTTTARYSIGGHTTQLTLLPQFSDSTELISSTRSAKGPKDSFYTDMLLNILTQPTFRGDSVRKIKRKDQQLLTQFVKSNIEDLNTPNKTIKLSLTGGTFNKTLKLGAVNRVRVTTTTHRPYRISTRKSDKVVPSQVIINVSKPVSVATVKSPTKVVPSTKAPFKIKLSPRPYIKLKTSGTTK
jgi:hypothetical protein